MQKIHLLGIALLTVACSTEPKIPTETPLVKRDTVNVVQRSNEIRQNTAAKVADGLTLSLWASDSLAPDPIALSIDDQGDVFLTRTNRQKNSEFDIRGHQDWMTESIGLKSVEERRAFLHKTFAPERSEENQWLKDLNGDGIHDWKDLTVEREEIWKLEDTDADGHADKASRIFNDLHDEVTDVAGALLVRKNDVFLGAGPDMWRLKDKNGDGVLEDKTSIAHGFAVHIGFGGHGMSGAIEGPDGKIYWGIGDIGANLTALDGSTYEYPNEGVIVRSNPDGSNFEVFAHGLRNTHEFVFDEYGNIISSDNDGDHPGESERLVYIVEGSDAGWRANWQYGKYTDPKNNGYNVWMDENMYSPRWDGQAAYFIPPIRNYHNGPTGMVYNPGTALGSKWKNSFFLVEFVGNPTRSHIWNFTLKPDGASFALDKEKDVLSGILPTGIRFGPDGALYVADWINGWNTKNYGRVWKLDVDAADNDLAAERSKTKSLMQLDYGEQSVDALYNLLFYVDMRIRQKAQFELVKRGKKGGEAFKKAIEQRQNQLARIHGIWGLGQLAARDIAYAENIIPLLQDVDPEIIAQAERVIGDVKYDQAGTQLIPLLENNNARVQFFAAQALGRIKFKEAVTPLLTMLEKNNGKDLYLRYAGVLALSRIGEVDPIIALTENPNKTLRLAAVLVLRKLGNPNVAKFLNDEDEYIVTEAARAINDDLSIEPALPQLAAVLGQDKFISEPLMRRAINASLRVGGDKEMNLLIAFANRKDVPTKLRAEALATLGTWANPSPLDRVDGRYRGEIKRDASGVVAQVKANMKNFLREKDPEVLVAIAEMLGNLGISDYNSDLAHLFSSDTNPDVRSAMLTALGKLNYKDMETLVRQGMGDKDQEVRTTAVSFISNLDIPKEKLPAVVDPIFKTGSTREQQEVLHVLGTLPIEKSASVLEGLIDQWTQGKLSPDVTLDLMEAVNATKSEALIAKLAPLEKKGTTVDAYKETLYGGNGRNGWIYFMNNSAGQCARCHSINGQGGTVGPPLQHIGSILSREQILQALIEPSARLSPGYGSVSLELKDGQKVTGILLEEHKDELILQTSQAEPLEVPMARIVKRTNIPSSMPPVGDVMSKREIRDMVEFLANMK
ncbi:HEAT repeat domain-containing protein [Flavobacteriaceae bacterium F89]|uniref:HEAT repeat domain-containing protein n=1 Tax=Cerina litoralis TaxID=2874477 RepID=A0AAE3EV01_9FLAO|nr:HEAT repeat domain-containing protein [Cerina litoralis]MCG2460788.1 HEAT repeat domain-containing protein [Cerina litoralis]